MMISTLLPYDDQHLTASFMFSVKPACVQSHTSLLRKVATLNIPLTPVLLVAHYYTRYIGKLGISPTQLVLGGAWYGEDATCATGTPPTARICPRATNATDQYRPLMPLAYKPTLYSITDVMLSGNATTSVCVLIRYCVRITC
jgi:hypothetical protein